MLFCGRNHVTQVRVQWWTPLNTVMNILSVTDIGEFIDGQNKCFSKHNFTVGCLIIGWQSFWLADPNTSLGKLFVSVLFKDVVRFWDNIAEVSLARELFRFDDHGSVHHNKNLIEMTNKMQLCRTMYYSIVSWLLNMFRAILSLIIRSWWWAIISLETYWAVKEQWNNKLPYTGPFCLSFL
jgi:hypothetical protein